MIMRQMSHVVLDVWLAPGEEEDPAGLVVAVLAAEVQGGEPATVLDVGVGATHLVGMYDFFKKWGLGWDRKKP